MAADPLRPAGALDRHPDDSRGARGQHQRATIQVGLGAVGDKARRARRRLSSWLERATVNLPRTLDAVEVRVLGCLLEKQQLTPEYYPLTVNALVAACNQLSSREPVMQLAEAEILAALDRLAEHVLAWRSAGARADRWAHNLDRRLELDAPAKAIITMLFLRGPQTPGELRARAGRMHAFAAPGDAEAVLRRLAGGPEPLVTELPRQPGRKEARWAHLAGGQPELPAGPPAPAEPPTRSGDLADRLERLEARVEELSTSLSALRSRLGE